jgi:hypothetical protein
MTFLTLLLACDPVARCEDLAVETYDGCNTDPHGDVDFWIGTCEAATDRDRDEWIACVGDVEASEDVAAYGWDDDACAALLDACGFFPN